MGLNGKRLLGLIAVFIAVIMAFVTPSVGGSVLAGQDTFFDSGLKDMDAGHFMQTEGALRANGTIEASTHIFTVTLFGGFTGATQLLFVDADGIVIGASEIHTFGVDGRWIGTSERTVPWTEVVDPNVVARTAEIQVLQYWAPKWGAVKNIVDRAVEAARPAVDVIRDLWGIIGK